MLKIKVIVCGLLLLAIQHVKAQQELMVEGISPDLHLTHTVVAKENWYSIGRLYNLPPKQLAAANNTTLTSSLSVGQSLKIPLAPANFSQNGVKAGNEVLVPVYYALQEKEWMYRVSVNHNKVPIETLQKWNNVTNDQLHPGMKLIVGYLRVRPDQSALAAHAGPGAPVPANANQPVADTKKESAPPVRSATTPTTDAKKDAGLAAADVKKDSPVRASTSVQPEVKKETAPPASSATRDNLPPAGQSTSPQPEIRTVSNTSRNGGYFRSQYAENGKGTAGNAGVFRSTSGWNDGKYYALMNNVLPGTIVRIFFQSTNKSVYAKVLGPMPEMKESVGLTLRISDAAASELGVTSGKFYVDVKY